MRGVSESASNKGWPASNTSPHIVASVAFNSLHQPRQVAATTWFRGAGGRCILIWLRCFTRTRSEGLPHERRRHQARDEDQDEGQNPARASPPLQGDPGQRRLHAARV